MTIKTESLVYEPPFGLGAVGVSRRAEDDAMPELLLEWIPVSEELRQKLEGVLKRLGEEDILQDILVTRESKKTTSLRFLLLELAMRRLMSNPNFPTVQEQQTLYSTFAFSNVTTKESYPITLQRGSSDTIIPEGLVNNIVALKGESLIFTSYPGATQPQYIRGRNMILEQANELFKEIGLSRIPQHYSFEE